MKKIKNFKCKIIMCKIIMNSNTLDEYTIGITVEAAMKHTLGNHKTIQDEAIKIGRDLLDSL